MDSSLKKPEFNFNSGSEPPQIYEFGDFQLHVAPRLLLKNGEELALRPKAVATLCVLAARSREVVSTDELMQRVWPDAVVEESNLAQYMHVLRKTLGTMPDGRPYIETLRRRGYRFNADVRSTQSRNGHSHSTEAAGPIGNVDEYKARHRPIILWLVVTSLVVACLAAGLFVAKTSGWFGGE